MRDVEATQKDGSGPRPVLVLTDRPPDYASDLNVPGIEPIFESTVAGLLERLAQQPVSGFVLEVDKVLRASGKERGHLFQLAEAFPLLRVRRSEQDESLAYLDDLQAFAAQVRGLSPRAARHVPRVPVLLRAILRRREGGSSLGVPATILDLSACGGALNCDAEMEPGEELALRILELSDPAPVSALICWCGRRGGRVPRRCAGVRFLDMHPGQAKELGARYLGAAAY